ncbi:hypothetical protein BDN67DRAFT_971081 [Paxillus ammoniavirescens]|nr:hypothetical protein BDN67DRAFT_971081 [Paxillus ammoniavirescens]
MEDLSSAIFLVIFIWAFLSRSIEILADASPHALSLRHVHSRRRRRIHARWSLIKSQTILPSTSLDMSTRSP